MGTWFSKARRIAKRVAKGGELTEMAIKKLLAAAGAVFVLVLGAVANQHGVEQGAVAVTLADGTCVGNTPWT